MFCKDKAMLCFILLDNRGKVLRRPITGSTNHHLSHLQTSIQLRIKIPMPKPQQHHRSIKEPRREQPVPIFSGGCYRSRLDFSLPARMNIPARLSYGLAFGRGYFLLIKQKKIIDDEHTPLLSNEGE